MERIKRKDLSTAANKFALSMGNDPLHVYFFPDAGTRKKKIKALYSFILKSRFNSVYTTSSSLEGIAVWENPQHNNFREIFNVSIIDGINMVFTIGLKTIIKMMRYEFWAVKQRKEIMTGPYWYLFVIIVDPAFQGKGFASCLMRPVLEEADKNNEKCFLETQNIKNVPIYEKFGFRIIREKKMLHTELAHYCMMRQEQENI